MIVIPSASGFTFIVRLRDARDEVKFDATKTEQSSPALWLRPAGLSALQGSRRPLEFSSSLRPADAISSPFSRSASYVCHSPVS